MRLPCPVRYAFEVSAASREGGRVDARRLEAVARHASEQGVGRRENRRAECDEGDEAPGLRGGSTERNALERPADVLARGNRNARPDENRRDQPRLDWLAIDLVRDEAGEHHRAL